MEVIWIALIISAIAAVAIAIRLGLRKTKCGDCCDEDVSIPLPTPIPEQIPIPVPEIEPVPTPLPDEEPEEPVEPIFDDPEEAVAEEPEPVEPEPVVPPLDVPAEVDEESFKQFPIPNESVEPERFGGDDFSNNDSFDSSSDFGSGLD